MIRTASEQDVPALKQLFATCFNDTDDDFLNSFFNDYFSTTTGMVAIRDKRIATMLFLCPATMKVNGIIRTLYYVYACGTLPEYRGLGLMKQLLETAFDYAKQQNSWGLLLVPAEKPLFGYYGKLGFGFFSSLKEKDIKPDKISQPFFSPYQISPDEAAAIRARRFDGDYQVQWDAAHIAFSASIADLPGGGLVGVQRGNGQNDYALCEKNETGLRVKETSVEEELLPQLSAFLQEQFAVATTRFYLPSIDKEPFSMAKPVNPLSLPPQGLPYFNLDMG